MKKLIIALAAVLIFSAGAYAARVFYSPFHTTPIAVDANGKKLGTVIGGGTGSGGMSAVFPLIGFKVNFKRYTAYLSRDSNDEGVLLGNAQSFVVFDADACLGDSYLIASAVDDVIYKRATGVALANQTLYEADRSQVMNITVESRWSNFNGICQDQNAQLNVYSADPVFSFSDDKGFMPPYSIK